VQLSLAKELAGGDPVIQHAFCEGSFYPPKSMKGAGCINELLAG